jgi:hypothetical protein
MGRYEQLTAIRARIAHADDKQVREVLLQLTHLGVSPDAFDRAFEEAGKVAWQVKRAQPLITRRPYVVNPVTGDQVPRPGAESGRAMFHLGSRQGRVRPSQ